MRLFTAIDIGALDGLVAAEGELEQTGARLKMVEPEIIHCTLKFLGEVEEHLIPAITEAMQRAVANVGPFTTTVRGMGVFPSPDYIKVIWVGLEGGPVSVIAQNLEEELQGCGFTKEKRPFTPHATLARVKGAQGKDRLQEVVQRHRDTVFGQVSVDSICLKKSELLPQGPVYTTLHTIPL